MHWILQSDERPDVGTRELWSTIERLGLPHSYHKVVPAFGSYHAEPTPPPIDGPVICIGSYALRHLARERSWTPGVFDIGHLTYADHVAHWSTHMLNSDAIYCAFRDVPRYLPLSEPYFFLRPTVDSKFFPGSDYTVEEFMPWYHKVVVLEEDTGNELRGSTEVMIASAKMIHQEYRVWIVDGEVVTASLYKRGGRVHYDSNVDADVIEFAAARAREWAPHRAYVIDVARTREGLSIVETNTLNAAGMYAANVGRIVAALEAMV